MQKQILSLDNLIEKYSLEDKASVLSEEQLSLFYESIESAKEYKQPWMRLIMALEDGFLNENFTEEVFFNWVINNSNKVYLETGNKEGRELSELTHLSLSKMGRQKAKEGGIALDFLDWDAWDNQENFRSELRELKSMSMHIDNMPPCEINDDFLYRIKNLELDRADSVNGYYFPYSSFWDVLMKEDYRTLEELSALVNGLPDNTYKLLNKKLDDLLFCDYQSIRPTMLDTVFGVKSSLESSTRACIKGDIINNEYQGHFYVKPMDYIAWYQNAKSDTGYNAFRELPDFIIKELDSHNLWDSSAKKVLREPIQVDNPEMTKKKRGRPPANKDSQENDQTVLQYWIANKGDYPTYQEILDNPPEGINFKRLGIKNSRDFDKAIRRAKKKRKSEE